MLEQHKIYLKNAIRRHLVLSFLASYIASTLMYFLSLANGSFSLVAAFDHIDSPSGFFTFSWVWVIASLFIVAKITKKFKSTLGIIYIAGTASSFISMIVLFFFRDFLPDAYFVAINSYGETRIYEANNEEHILGVAQHGIGYFFWQTAAALGGEYSHRLHSNSFMAWLIAVSTYGPMCIIENFFTSIIWFIGLQIQILLFFCYQLISNINNEQLLDSMIEPTQKKQSIATETTFEFIKALDYQWTQKYHDE